MSNLIATYYATIGCYPGRPVFFSEGKQRRDGSTEGIVGEGVGGEEGMETGQDVREKNIK